MRPDPPEKIALVLGALRQEPATIEDLARITHLRRRRVEEALEAIRRGGLVPVCSGPEGVWVARTVTEYEANVDARRRRFVTQALTVRAERRLLRRLMTPGQGRLWEGVA